MNIPKRLTVRVNLDNVLKEHIYKGAKGQYLDLILFNTPENQYGNDYVVKQDIPQDKRPDDVPILGNAKAWEADGGRKNFGGNDVGQAAPKPIQPNGHTPPPQPTGQQHDNEGLPF